MPRAELSDKELKVWEEKARLWSHKDTPGAEICVPARTLAAILALARASIRKEQADDKG